MVIKNEIEAQMIIHKLTVVDGFECINVVDKVDYKRLASMNGEIQAPTWTSIEVRRVAADHKSRCLSSDFPWLGGYIIIMRDRARLVLDGFWGECGEVLSLSTTDNVHLHLLNVTRTIDALDEEKSTITRFPSTGAIMRIDTYSFRAATLTGVDIFRLPLHTSPIFVSDRFVESVANAGLQGLGFKRVWSDSDNK
jgi:hypothetical protein